MSYAKTHKAIVLHMAADLFDALTQMLKDEGTYLEPMQLEMLGGGEGVS